MIREKNILFITNLHLWSLDKGKGGKAFYNTVMGYKNADWNIWLISTGGGVPEGIIDKNNLFENSYPKLDRLWLSKNKFVSIFSRFFRQMLINLFYLKHGNIILNNNPNMVIYAYEVGGVYAGKKLSKKFKRPFVTRFQGTIHNNTPNTLFNWVRKSPHLGALATTADLCIMTNDGTQGDKVLDRLENKSKKILFWRNGVSKVGELKLAKRELFRLQHGFSDFFVFLTVSRLVVWKKVERAILAFSKIHIAHPEAILVILGDGSAKENLINLTSELGVSNKVLFKGAVPQNEVSDYMIAADVFLSFYDLSNVGNPLMEAMSCGKPIITLDVGDTKELIKHKENGILLKMDQLDMIPDYMSRLVNDKELLQKLADGALKTADADFWTWEDRICREIEEVGNLSNNS